jgi:translation initiation factor IF-2
MSKIKVLDLAQEVGMEDDKLLSKLKGMGVKVKEKTEEEAEGQEGLAPDERVIERDEMSEIVEKRVKPTVIRRRVRTLPPKETEPEAPPPVEGEQEPVTVEVAEARPEPEKVGEDIAAEAREEAGAPEKKVEIPPSEPVTKEVPPEIEEKTTPSRAEAVETPSEQKKKRAKRAEREEEELQKRRPRVATRREEFKRKRVDIGQLEGEEEEKVQVPKGRAFYPVKRPMKKKVVTRASKKTEITVPKAIKRVIR